jgi:hypothetical protein
VSLHLRIDYKYNYKKIKEKDNTNVILIIINISGRSSLEEANHVKSIGQKYGSNRALGNFDGSQNPRTHSAVYPRLILGTKYSNTIYNITKLKNFLDLQI